MQAFVHLAASPLPPKSTRGSPVNGIDGIMYSRCINTHTHAHTFICILSESVRMDLPLCVFTNRFVFNRPRRMCFHMRRFIIVLESGFHSLTFQRLCVSRAYITLYTYSDGPPSWPDVYGRGHVI